MGQLITSKIIGAVKGLFSSLDAADTALLTNVLIFDQVQAIATDGGVAATAQTETWVYQNLSGTNQLVTSISAGAPVAITGDNTNNAVITITKRDSAGITPVVVGTLTTSVATGNWTAFLPKLLTLTAANVIVPPNGQLTVLVSKGGTGVAIASATAQMRLQIQLTPVD